MLGHVPVPVTARASRCEKAVAFAGEHRNPPHLQEFGGSRGGTDPFSQKIIAVRRQSDPPRRLLPIM